MMQLQFKTDLMEACNMWRKFWARENERPLICARNLSTKIPSPYPLTYYRGWHEEYRRELFDNIDAFFQDSQFHAEAIPFFPSSLGPDSFAAALGGTLTFIPEQLSTNWMHPFVSNWTDFSCSMEQIRLNDSYRKWVSFAKELAEAGKGKYFAGVADLHSGMDALSAMRGPEMLCLDLFDDPNGVAEAMRQVRRVYADLYIDLQKARSVGATEGSLGWIPSWSEGRFAVTQCDFGCMISVEDFVQYQLPAIREELDFLDNSIYHLDGPGNLRHLDTLLQLEKLDGIQWVSGAGEKPMWQWTEVLHKIKDAGKLMQIHDLEIADVKYVHRKLGGYRGCFYSLNGNVSEAEVEELKSFFAKN